MTDDPKYLSVQATRSFNEYIQGANYVIDTANEQHLTLLGAGYFSTDHNPALTIDVYADSAQVFSGNSEDMKNQEHVDVEAGYQPANDVEVPEKMTGTQRASVDDEAENTTSRRRTTANRESNSGKVGTGSDSDSGSRAARGSQSGKSSGSRDN